ncbi:MAG TPA: phospho-N-acetylmuramoyl-pentapeptide-transferase [Bacillota bacterium]|nr:phospho-N-acetylmuramoyl-pentapeptide-transferase [Bacillota bacterium]
MTLIMGIILIPLLKRLRFGQNVRDDGPKSHLAKTGTPTMGGIIFLIPIILTSLIFTDGDLSFTFVVLLATLAFGLIGFIDDYINVVMKRSLGLRAYQKIIGQTAIAAALAYYAYSNPHIGSSIIIPFFGGEWDLGVLYIPVTIFITVGIVNSVNLTDGLDGLATGVTLVVSATLTIIASYAALAVESAGITYLVENFQNLVIFAAALTGACLGFLRYNAYPAKVFMGDTGSLGIGGAIAALTILLRIPLWLPIIGGVYMAEALSVIIQVASYKLTGKRVFKMSPLHHHFELSGIPETKVVAMFMIATVVLCLFALMSI